MAVFTCLGERMRLAASTTEIVRQDQDSRERGSRPSTLRPTDNAAAGVPVWARWPVVAIAAAVAAALGVTSGRYGYFGDELYFLAAGRHLSWSYADQPPLVPLLARLMDTLFPDSVAALRLPATLATAAGVIVASLIARELGGERRAQVLAAATYAVSFGLLGSGHELSTYVLDSFGWTVITWLLVRWVRTRQDRLLLASGLVTTVCLQIKDLVAVFWIVLACAVLLAGPRDLLRRPMLWAGAGVAVVCSLPNLWWQAHHGWPEHTMTALVAAEQDLLGGRLVFVPLVLLYAGLPAGAVLFCYGTWRLLRSAELAPYRFLGWTILGVLAVFLVNNGRQSYVTGLFGLAIAAAAVELCRGQPAGWWRWTTAWPIYALTAVVAVTMTLPLRPLSWDRGGLGSPVTALSTEWPELTAAVGGAVNTVPEGERAGAVVLADTYWQASALDQFGPTYGLPKVYSANRGFWYFGAPPDGSGPTVFLGSDATALRRYFENVRKVGSFDNPRGMPGINTGVSIWVCTGQRVAWSQIWPALRDFDVNDRITPLYRPAEDPDRSRSPRP